MTDKLQPCPHCGEAIAAEAGSCPHCRRRTLFDLLTLFEIKDDRTAYHAARGLLEVRGLPHDFLTVRYSLQNAPGPAVTAVPKSVAWACQEKLTEFGIETQITRQVPRPPVVAEEEPAEKVPLPRRVWLSIRESPGISAAILLGLAILVVLVVLDRNGSTGPPSAAVDPVGDGRLVEIAQFATVTLTCEQRRGSGFFIDTATVITAAESVCPAIPGVSVRFADGRTEAGRVTRIDQWLGIAVVRLGADTVGRPIELADASGLYKDDQVRLVDNRAGAGIVASRGRITNANRSIFGIAYLEVAVEAGRAAVGSPVLDVGGRAVGVVTMAAGLARNQRLALPANYLVDGRSKVLLDHEMYIDPVRWRTRVRDAETMDEQSVEVARANPSQAGLAGARCTQPNTVDAIVARWSPSDPSTQSFSFTLRRGDRVLCSKSGDAREWRRITEGGVPVTTSRYLMWLERHGFLDDVFVSTVRLDASDCGERSEILGATMVLHNGKQYADRSLIIGN